MKNASVKLLLVFAGALLFNILFWQEKLGVNAAIFDAFIICSVFYLYPGSIKKPLVAWLSAGHLLTVAAVIIQNTLLSKLACSTTLMLLVVFAQFRHRSVWYAAGSAIMNFLLLVPSFFTNIQLVKGKPLNLSMVRKLIRFAVIPVSLLFVFLVLYNISNSIFQRLLTDVGTAIGNAMELLFSLCSWQRTLFLLLGLVVTGGLLLKNNIGFFSETDSRKGNDLWRKKNDLAAWRQSSWFDLLSILMGRFANGMMALRNEQKTAIISLVLLNLLLFCINCVDIVYVWFGFTYKNDLSLSQYVHEGAGLLIFSIFLAIMLLLFFFRGNLNFYQKNKWLRVGAYGWLAQNAVLAVSVCFRDFYYIQHNGLAYKRIGVLVFLLLVVAGLVTVFIKIQQRKTTYYLLRVNAWFAIIVLVIASCVHWDEAIAQYNLARKDTIPVDIKFLLSLSDKVLPVLQKNVDVLDRVSSSNMEGRLSYRSSRTPRQAFEQRKKEFADIQHQYSWLSWNLCDDYVKKELSHTMQASAIK